MSVGRLLRWTGLFLALAGTLLACFTFGGWLNQPMAFTYKYFDTGLARLNRLLGFVPYYDDTVLPLLGVSLMLAGTLLVAVSWSFRPRLPRTEPGR